MSQCQSNAKREVLIIWGSGQPSPVQAKPAAVVTYILPNVRNFFTKLHNQIDKHEFFMIGLKRNQCE